MENCTKCNLLKISHVGGGKIEPPIFSLFLLTTLILFAAFLKGYHDGKNSVTDQDLKAVTSTAVEVKASLFHNRDSVNYYAQRAFENDDPQGQFVVGACYYLREQGDLPEDIYVVSHNLADSMLIYSAVQNYEPAINLIHCLHDNNAWRWEY